MLGGETVLVRQIMPMPESEQRGDSGMKIPLGNGEVDT